VPDREEDAFGERDLELIMEALMRIDAKLEGIRRLLEEEDDGEEEAEADG
jgi:hypothetical protein